jgi:hypothetical protein
MLLVRIRLAGLYLASSRTGLLLCRTVSIQSLLFCILLLSLSLILRPTVSRSVCLGIKHPSGAYDQIFITVWQLRVCWFGAPSLTRGPVCHLQLLQSFSGSSPVGLVAIFYCLRFETSLFVASYDSQGYGGGIRPRLHTGSLDLSWLHADRIWNTPCNGTLLRFCGCHRNLSFIAVWTIFT